MLWRPLPGTVLMIAVCDFLKSVFSSKKSYKPLVELPKKTSSNRVLEDLSLRHEGWSKLSFDLTSFTADSNTAIDESLIGTKLCLKIVIDKYVWAYIGDVCIAHSLENECNLNLVDVLKSCDYSAYLGPKTPIYQGWCAKAIDYKILLFYKVRL